MTREITKLFRAPYSVPNGLQVTNDGLWIADQITDRIALVEISEPTESYGVTKLIRDISSESSNTSGMAYGEGALWLAANGGAQLWRPERPTDAKKGFGEILKVDPQTGETLGRYPLPGDGGTHGLEYDFLDPGHLWLTTLKNQTMTKIRIEDWAIQHVISLPYKRGHGAVLVPDGIWVVHTGDRVIVKLDPVDGNVLDRINVPEPHPEPHGLSIFGEHLLYCDATSGWVVKIAL